MRAQLSTWRRRHLDHAKNKQQKNGESFDQRYRENNGQGNPTTGGGAVYENKSSGCAVDKVKSTARCSTVAGVFSGDMADDGELWYFGGRIC